MSIVLPLYAQEKRNTCALACLRMVLAASGILVEESTIEAKAHLEEGGTPIEELERLARQFGLIAHIQRATIDQLRVLLAGEKLPIVYLNRKVFDLTSLRHLQQAFTDPLLHSVIPTRVSGRFVTFHDPMQPRVVRRSIERFERAQHFVGNATLVCELPER